MISRRSIAGGGDVRRLGAEILDDAAAGRGIEEARDVACWTRQRSAL